MCVAFMSSSVAMLAQERLDMLCFALESMAGISHLGDFALSGIWQLDTPRSTRFLTSVATRRCWCPGGEHAWVMQ